MPDSEPSARVRPKSEISVPPEDPWRKRFGLSATLGQWLLILYGALGVGGALAIVWAPGREGLISFLVAVAAGGIALLGVVRGAGNLQRSLDSAKEISYDAARRAEQQAERDLKSTRVRKALSFVERWNGLGTQQARDRIREALPKIHEMSVADMPAGIDNNLATKRAVLDIMNFFEEIALAISLDEADDEVCYAYFSEIIDRAYKTLRPWTDARRKKEGAAFEQLKILSGQWGARPN